MNSPHGLTVAAAEQHTCGAANCGTDIPAETFLCEPHTKMLPALLRHAIRRQLRAQSSSHRKSLPQRRDRGNRA